MMRLYLLVTFGGARGSAARSSVSGCVANRFGQTIPWGILLVNVTGCFLIGFFATLTDPAEGRVFAGATVLRGSMGFGKSSRLHTSKILRLSHDLPVVIEITDSEEKINAFLPVLDGMMGGGLVTLEKVRAIRYLGTTRPI